MDNQINQTEFYQQLYNQQSEFYQQIIGKQEFLLNALGVIFGIIGIVAGLSFWYQVKMNNKTINELKEENASMIVASIRPFLTMNIENCLRVGAYSFDSLEEIFSLYTKYFKDDKEIKKLVKTLRNATIIREFTTIQFDTELPDEDYNLSDMKKFVKKERDRLVKENNGPFEDEEQDRVKKIDRAVLAAKEAIRISEKSGITF